MFTESLSAQPEYRETPRYRPQMSQCGLDPTHEARVLDQSGSLKTIHAAAELALTILVDDQEIVTLMTLGTEPEKLALGYLKNQKLIEELRDIKSVEVDWDRETASVCTKTGEGVNAIDVDNRHKIVTTGCGQGTIYSCTLDKLYEHRLQAAQVKQSSVYAVLSEIKRFNAVYRKAGSVHGCGLIGAEEVLYFVEDVGRHNAMDTIAGEMWLENISGANKLFYTTGRLTSEIVMKSAMMGIPALVSRNGVTQMAIELAEDLGVMLIARAKSRHFQVFSCHDQMVFDASTPFSK